MFDKRSQKRQHTFDKRSQKRQHIFYERYWNIFSPAPTSWLVGQKVTLLESNYLDYYSHTALLPLAMIIFKSISLGNLYGCGLSFGK